MNDKKKILVVAVLVVAVFGVGAFQFVNMSNSEAPKPQAASQKGSDEASLEEAPEVQGMEFFALAPRDPFQEGVLAPLDNAQPQASTPQPTHAPKPPRYSKPSGLGGNNPWTLPPGSGTTPVIVTPSEPLRMPGEYEVAGIITGAKPAAVFVDANGNQRLVTVGGSLDGDSQLVAVEKGKVTIRQHGKTKTINVGGTPNAK